VAADEVVEFARQLVALVPWAIVNTNDMLWFRLPRRETEVTVQGHRIRVKIGPAQSLGFVFAAETGEIERLHTGIVEALQAISGRSSVRTPRQIPAHLHGAGLVLTALFDEAEQLERIADLAPRLGD